MRSFMRAFPWVTLVAVLVGVPGLVPPVTAAETPGAVTVPSAVHDRARREGSARVIVELRLPVPHEPETRLPGLAAVMAQRREIATRGSQVLARLRNHPHRLVRRLTTAPLLVVEAGPQALAALEAPGLDVARVVEDRLNEPLLFESVPLVGADQAWAQGFDGSGTVIAVIDSGVDAQHEFLAGKVVEEACYSTTSGLRSRSLCPSGADEQTGPGAAAPCTLEGCWHGTHVAGIAAGADGPAELPFSGVGRGAQLMAVQIFSRFDGFFDCGGAPPCIRAYDSDVLAALERVYELRQVRPVAAVNLSLGGGSFSAPCDTQPYKPIIDNLRAAGIATVAASGNSGTPGALTSPACISTAVSVGATTKDDQVADFSNGAAFLSLLAPGAEIVSSFAGGGFAFASGTSMASPHVAGAWAILRQAAPGASVDQVLTALQGTGLPVADPRPGGAGARPRIRVALALAALLEPDTPILVGVSPDRGTQGQSLTVTIQGANFQAGATATFGPGVTVTSATVLSPVELAAVVSLGAAASLGPRDVVVTNPGGHSATLPASFLVIPPPPAVTLTYLGLVRDRVGRDNTAYASDGAADAVVRVALGPGSGAREVTRLELRSNAAGLWDTDPATWSWSLGAASGIDGALVNAATGAVSFGVSDGGSFVVFAAEDSVVRHFQGGRVLTLVARFADGSVATTTVTIVVPAPPPVTLAYLGTLRDRVGRANTAYAADGALDGTLQMTLGTGGGPRTVTRVELRSSAAGLWDSDPATQSWSLGVAMGVDATLLNGPGGAVGVDLAEGQAVNLFAAEDTVSGHFAGGRTLTVTVSFADGSVTTASTTVVVPPPPGLTLTYLGLARDRVGRGNTSYAPDNAMDGAVRVTLAAGSGPRTVTSVELRSSAAGLWDTDAATWSWSLGVANGPDDALLNAPGGVVNAAIPAGGTLHVFAAEDAVVGHFRDGRTLTLTARFADGSVATATVTIAVPPASIGLAVVGLARDRVGQGNTAYAPDGAVDGSLLVTINAGTGSRTVTRLELRSSAAGLWDTDAASFSWSLGAAPELDGALLNGPGGAVSFPVTDGATFTVFAAEDPVAGHFAGGRTLTLTARFADGSSATASATVVVPPPPALTLTALGLARDRVARGNTAYWSDGAMDGTLRVTLGAGSGPRAVTRVELRSSAAGLWDTDAATWSWSLGAAPELDDALLNGPSGAVTFAVADGGSFHVFASEDPATGHFNPGRTLTVTVRFADGSTATASTTP